MESKINIRHIKKSLEKVISSSSLYKYGFHILKLYCQNGKHTWTLNAADLKGGV